MIVEDFKFLGEGKNFESNGFGFNLLVDNEIACQIISASVVDKKVEINIVTSENHRKKGYASILTSSFIEFIALIIRSKIYAILKDEMKRISKRPNYMTVPAALKELEKIEMVRQLDNIYRLDHAVTATQKKILKAFSLDENYIKHKALEISEKIK